MHGTAAPASRAHVVDVMAPVVVQDTVPPVAVVGLAGLAAMVTVGAGVTALTIQVAVSEPVPSGPETATTIVWTPTARPLSALGEVHAVAAPPSTAQDVPVTAPVVVQAMLALVLVVFAGRGAMVTVGGGPSTDQVAVSVALPPGPVTDTTTAWAPSARPA